MAGEQYEKEVELWEYYAVVTFCPIELRVVVPIRDVCLRIPTCAGFHRGGCVHRCQPDGIMAHTTSVRLLFGTPTTLMGANRFRPCINRRWRHVGVFLRRLGRWRLTRSDSDGKTLTTQNHCNLFDRCGWRLPDQFAAIRENAKFCWRLFATTTIVFTVANQAVFMPDLACF